jgi:hypothetical protein
MHKVKTMNPKKLISHTSREEGNSERPVTMRNVDCDSSKYFCSRSMGFRKINEHWAKAENNVNTRTESSGKCFYLQADFRNRILWLFWNISNKYKPNFFVKF